MKTITHVMTSILVVVLIAGTFLTTSHALADESLEDRVLEEVSEQQKIAPESLEVADLTRFDFPLTGVSVYQAKVMDMTNGNVYAMTVDGEGLDVDLAAARAAEMAAHQSLYGSLDPNLHGQLQTLADGDMLDVGIWLKGEIQTSQPDVDPGAVDVPGAQVSSGSGEKTAEQIEQAEDAQAQQVQDAQAAGRAAALAARQANSAQVAAQVAAFEAALLADLQAFGYQPTYASPYAPLVYVRMSKADILDFAQMAYVDTIYGPNEYQDMMDSAKPAQKADIVDSWFGFDGAGIKVAILEDSRVEFGNPYLNAGTTRVPGDPNMDQHASATAGMVASQHATYQGIAQGVTMFSANATSYTDPNLSAAMDWAAITQNIDVINNSWGGNDGNTNLNVHDRHLDYIVRNHWATVTVAAGNEGGASNRVGSPARGYNVISVGNHTDQGNNNWADDVMNSSSSYINPSTSVEKPEVAAVGTSINSTLQVSPWVGATGSGTSYSAPMVAGEAALIMERDSTFVTRPEMVKAAIMASALHNIEGSSRLSDKDGAGGVDMRAAFRLADSGWRAWYSIDTTFTEWNYSFAAYAGERVRVAIAFDSNPDGAYTIDPLQADIDLQVLDPSDVVVASSSSSVNPFEVVDFVAPATQTYKIRVYKWSMSAGSTNKLGIGFWPGMVELDPYVERVWGTPGVSRHYFKITPGSYWNAIGIRSPASNDYDVFLYGHSAFGSPSDYNWLEDSTTTEAVDYVVIDRNHAPSGDYFLETYRFGGAGGNYPIEYASHTSDTAVEAGSYGPYTMGSNDILRIWDTWIAAGTFKCFRVDITAGNGDLAVRLFKSDSATPASMFQGKSQAIRTVDSLGAGGDESFCYASTSSDWYGLVVDNKGQTTNTTFTLYVPYTMFLPLTRR